MKKLLFLYVLLSFNFAQSQNGEKKTYYNFSGKILDRDSYEKAKKTSLESYKKKIKEVYIEDEFIAVRETKDSIIKTVKLNVFTGQFATLREKKQKIYSLIGKKFPFSSIKDSKGNWLDEKNYIGKPTLINLWFTACKPCVEEIPSLNAIAEEFKGRVNFLSMTFEKKEKVESFLKKHKFNFTVITDSKKVLDKLDVPFYPANVFINKEGIVEKIEGAIPYTMERNKKISEKGDATQFINILKELL